MIYICEDCNRTFDNDAAMVVHNNHEHFGCYCFEDLLRCPMCGGDLMEIACCELCGEPAPELFGGVCLNCIDSKRFDADFCLSLDSRTEEVEINAFLASVFEPSEIENILRRELSKIETVDCSKFIDGDVDWFGEQILKEAKTVE